MKDLHNIKNIELIKSIQDHIQEIEERIENGSMDPLQISGNTYRTDGTLTFGDFYESSWISSDHC